VYTEKTSRQVTERILSRLVAATDVTITSAGSMARTLTELISDEIGSAYSFMSANIQQAFISTAGGAALDRLGVMFGLERKNVNPVINSSSGAVLFYLTKKGEPVSPGHATQYASADVTIPAGTIIGTDPLHLGSDDPDLFKVEQDVVIPAGSYMAYASVTPMNSIKQTTAGGAVRYHTFNPTTAPVNSLGDELQINVFNRLELQVNRYIESDTNFRYRIVNALTSIAGATSIALRLAALGVEGVRDCQVYPLARGIGTAEVIVILEDPAGQNATDVFQEAVDAVRSKVSVGDLVNVKRPIESSVDMMIKVTFKDGRSNAQILTQVEQVVTSYINSLSVKDTLSISRLYGLITSLSPEIVNTQVVDTTFMVDGVSVVVADYTCASDQQLFAADIVVV
jgi:uncharacterized phage protein gp47/JayE